MYVCYLDDSGTHENAEVVVSGGYVAPLAGWRRYERESAKFYKKHQITVFHSKKFKKNFGEFRGWSAAKHMGFIQCMIDAAVSADAVGVTVGLNKKLLAVRKQEHRFLPQTSAYAQSFKSVLDRLAADADVGAMIRKDGLSVVIESGNANDDNIRAEFKRLQRLSTFDFLESFSAVKKGGLRAVQLADFMAHYSWLHAEQWPKYDRKERGFPEMDLLLRMMINGVRTIGNYVEDIIPLTPETAQLDL